MVIRCKSGGSNYDYHKDTVTSSNDAILNEVGWTTAVYLMGTQPWPGGALEHLVVPLGNVSLGVWFLWLLGLTAKIP
jgi:hypothetical protein